MVVAISSYLTNSLRGKKIEKNVVAIRMKKALSITCMLLIRYLLKEVITRGRVSDVASLHLGTVGNANMSCQDAIHFWQCQTPNYGKCVTIVAVSILCDANW